MGIKIGDIDVGKQIIENEFRISVLEQIIEEIINYDSKLADLFNYNNTIQKIHKTVTLQLQKKYPNSGIEYTKAEK